jgi:hypothetical protein
MNKREYTKIFKAAGLNKDQISYAHTLRSMYATTPLERIIEMAREYVSMSEAFILIK